MENKSTFKTGKIFKTVSFATVLETAEVLRTPVKVAAAVSFSILDTACAYWVFNSKIQDTSKRNSTFWTRALLRTALLEKQLCHVHNLSVQDFKHNPSGSTIRISVRVIYSFEWATFQKTATFFRSWEWQINIAMITLVETNVWESIDDTGISTRTCLLNIQHNIGK